MSRYLSLFLDADASPIAPLVPVGPNGSIGTSGGGHVVASDETVERAAIIEHGAGVPREWAEGYARLSLMPQPASVPVLRWRRLVDNAGDFIDRFAPQAAALGWDAESIFGCHPTAPDARLDYAGLVWLVGKGHIAAITAETAVIGHEDGTHLTYRRTKRPGGTLAWEITQ